MVSFLVELFHFICKEVVEENITKIGNMDDLLSLFLLETTGKLRSISNLSTTINLIKKETTLVRLLDFCE